MQDAQYQTPPIAAPGVALPPVAIQPVSASPAADEAATELLKAKEIRVKLEEEFRAAIKSKEQFESATQAAQAAAAAAGLGKGVGKSKDKANEVEDLTGESGANQNSKNDDVKVIEPKKPPNPTDENHKSGLGEVKSGAAASEAIAKSAQGDGKATVAKAPEVAPPPKVAPKEGQLPKTLHKSPIPSPPPPPPPPPASTPGQTQWIELPRPDRVGSFLATFMYI